MPQTYEITHEIDQLASRVIAEFHPHLKDARIAYLYRNGSWANRGRVEFGKLLVAPPAWKALTGYDLLAVVNHAVYENYTEEERIAQLDHTFSYVGSVTTDSYGQTVYHSTGPDIYEFSAVVNRHNITVSNLDAIDMNGRQLSINTNYRDKAECANKKAAEEAAAKTEAAAEEMAGSGESGEELEPFCTLEDGDGRSPDDVEVVKSFEFNR